MSKTIIIIIMLVVLDRAEIFILTGCPRGFLAFGFLKRDIGGIGLLMRTTGNALSVGSDNSLHAARYNTRRASCARSDNPLHVNIVSSESCGVWLSVSG